MFALAAWLLYLDARAPLNRSLALFLFLYGMYLGLLSLGANVFEPPGRIRTYFILAIPFAAAHFFLTYARARRAPDSKRPTRGFAVGFAFIWGTCLAVEVAYALNHAWYLYPIVTANGKLNAQEGPLALVEPWVQVSFALVAYFAALRFLRAEDRSERTGWLLCAVGFLPEALYLSSFFSIDTVFDFMANNGDWQYYNNPYGLYGRGMMFVTLGICFAAIVNLLRAQRGPARSGFTRALPLVLVMFGLVFVSAFGSAALYPVDRRGFILFHFTIRGIWVLFAPILLAYGVARHHLFGIDIGTRIAIQQSTVAAIFVGVFLVSAQIAQNFFGNAFGGTWGWATGGIVAGLLLFGIDQLQRFAHNLAGWVMPQARRLDAFTPEERVGIYREQARLAWLDGKIARSERFLLNRLRDRLGIGADEAMRLEGEILQFPVATRP